MSFSTNPSSSSDASAHPSSSDASAHPSSSSSDPIARTQEDLKYSCALNATVSNFVSVKLSGDHNYHLWERQMRCLLESYSVHEIIFGDRPVDNKNRFNILVKGWIFSTISEELLDTVVLQEYSAREVWDKLKSFYQPTTMSPHEKAETYAKDKVADSTEAITKEHEEGLNLNTPKGTIAEMLIRNMQRQSAFRKKTERNKALRKAILEGNWYEVESMINEDNNVIKEPINSDGNTMLHIAVGMGRNSLVRIMLSVISKNNVELSEMKNKDGSTPLHIAAIVGNKQATDLLVKGDKKMLESQDHNNKTPLDKAYESMHVDTIESLLKAVDDKFDGIAENKSSPLSDKIGVNLLVNAVSAKQYDLATYLINKYPTFAGKNDMVLMAMAKTFPSGLDSWEILIYPSRMEYDYRSIVQRSRHWFNILVKFYRYSMNIIRPIIPQHMILSILKPVAFIIIGVPLVMLFWILRLILVLISMVYFPFSVFYFFLWKISSRLVAPIKRIEKKMKEWEEAKKVLNLVCNEIDKVDQLPDTYSSLYTKPILEAACHDAYEVVDEILTRSPGAIRYKDESGHDIIQLAILHRSEKIYNLIYITGERRSVYRMMEDASQSNLLHLVGRLPPPHKLNLRTGAALQLQRELQWREEVKKHVSPAYITKENIFMETPAMIFTKEHKILIKEGEMWMKTVAESCSITATLITTIVFAAAITVPGGSDEKEGTPLLKKDIAFTIFGISDAISLFASSTALLMFLSILTGRFSEQDFLVSLPKRLIIGLCTLLISTTTMMVAFSATLFLVFCDGKPWILAPICVSALVPIATFSTLQIPLIVDLFWSTYLSTFGNQSDTGHRFNLDDIGMFFGY